MSEVIERAGRAIWALNLDTDCPDYDDLAIHAKKRANELASAAIKALRDPTNDMISAGDMYDVSHYGIQQIWQAMIDEALNSIGEMRR